MIDQDEFDPLGKQWTPAHTDFQSDVPSDKIANEALRVATVMLRTCGGCPIFPLLQEALLEYNTTLSSHSLWSPTLDEADNILSEKLDDITLNIQDQRIAMVAIRSTRKTALELREREISLKRPSELGSHLGAQIIKDLIGHSFLDTSRALSVGGRFQTSEQAFHFYEDVMAHIEPAARKMGRWLARKPTCERLRWLRILPKVHNTSTIMYSDEFRLDLEV